jgi:hypothetical protein
MPHFQIKCRFTGGVRFEGEFGSLRLCVEAGVKARADLARANLARANLAGAYLAGAYLAGADLARANLAGAYLAGAYLAGAYLAGADLAGSNLAGAEWREGVKLRARGIVKEATRSDGYRVFLLDTQADGRWRVQAGCRFFTLPEAWRHWETTRAGTALGEETFDILVMFEHHAERLEKERA